MFLLIFVQDWNFIHAKLKVTQNKPDEMTVLKRIEYMDSPSFPWENMDVDVLDRVNAILKKYPYEQVNHVSQSAAAVYKWVCINYI